MGEPFPLTTMPFKSCVWGSDHAAVTDATKAMIALRGDLNQTPFWRSIYSMRGE